MPDHRQWKAQNIHKFFFLGNIYLGGGGGVNVISSDYCCDPDIYPWGYHQHPPQCCEYYIDTQKKCQKMCEML